MHILVILALPIIAAHVVNYCYLTAEWLQLRLMSEFFLSLRSTKDTMGIDFLHRMYVLFLLLLLLLQCIGVPHGGFTGHFEAIMVLVFLPNKSTLHCII